ncbi:MAG: hypothetical protein ACLTBR_03270 [Anaerostipes sp.]|uniref:hypothetical protein n=1 Tax=Anaerostipes sp. TaxID=1872530 RepID=UPI0039967A95
MKDKNINVGSLKGIMEEISNILSCAPEECDCSEIENDMYANMQNLLESMRFFLDNELNKKYMEKLTKQEAIKLHRHMWNWIADKTERTGEFIEKSDYFDAMKIPPEERPYSLCYCCEYGKQQSNGVFTGRCKYCPLDWKSKGDYYTCCRKGVRFDGKGLFRRWSSACNIEESIELARKIANLEVR